MQNNSKYTINCHRFHLSGSQSLSHIATIPFHLWYIYMVFPLSPPCLWPWVRLEIVHQPSSLHHRSCCQSSLLKINSENHVISLITLALYGFVWHSKSSTIWVYCGSPAYLFLKNYFKPNLLQNLPRSSQCLSSSATGFLVLSYIYKLTHTLFLVWVLHACLRPSLMWDLPGSQDHSFLSFLYSQCPSCHCRVITHHT